MKRARQNEEILVVVAMDTHPVVALEIGDVADTEGEDVEEEATLSTTTTEVAK
jgi:hypothetical protein